MVPKPHDRNQRSEKVTVLFPMRRPFWSFSFVRVSVCEYSCGPGIFVHALTSIHITSFHSDSHGPSLRRRKILIPSVLLNDLVGGHCWYNPTSFFLPRHLAGKRPPCRFFGLYSDCTWTTGAHKQNTSEPLHRIVCSGWFDKMIPSTFNTENKSRGCSSDSPI